MEIKTGSENHWRGFSPPHRFANKEVILDLTIDHSFPTEPPLFAIRSTYLASAFHFLENTIPSAPSFPITKKKECKIKKKEDFVCDFLGPKGVYSTHSPVSRTARRVRLRMRTSFPFALPTLRSHGYQSGGRVGSRYHEPSVPHIYRRSKCSSPVPPNAPISRQRSCECAVMLRMLRHGIDRPSFPVLFRCTRFISPTHKEGRGGKEAALASVRPIIPLASRIHAPV